MADCYKIDTDKESYYNEKNYILISQNVAFNLADCYKIDTGKEEASSNYV